MAYYVAKGKKRKKRARTYSDLFASAKEVGGTAKSKKRWSKKILSASPPQETSLVFEVQVLVFYVVKYNRGRSLSLKSHNTSRVTLTVLQFSPIL